MFCSCPQQFCLVWELRMNVAEISCWDVANIWFRKKKKISKINK
jgi:hypothetical protein